MITDYLLEEPASVYVHAGDRPVRLQRTADGTYTGGDVAVELSSSSGRISITVDCASQPLSRIVVRWRLPAGMLARTGVRILSDSWERAYGDLEWRGIVAERVMPWYFLCRSDRGTDGVGVTTGASSLACWKADETGITLCLDVRSGAGGVELNGRTLEAATIVTREGSETESPFQAARAFARLMCAEPRLPDHPVYGGNNWYFSYGNSSRRQVMEHARFLAELSPDTANRPYMVIDDGWQLCHTRSCNGGPWTENFRFPDMPGIAAEMEAHGVRPGVWIRPLLSSRMVPEECVLQREPFSGRFRFDGVVLDPSSPATLDLVTEDIERIRGWGYRMLKHDFSTFDLFGQWGYQMGDTPGHGEWQLRDRSRTTAEVINSFYHTIRAAAGDMLVIGCNTIGHLAAGVFELQRTGDDTSGKLWERTRKYGVNTLAFRMPQHEAFFAADADCAPITSKIPWELSSQWLDLLAHSGTPLFVSADLQVVGEPQRYAISDALHRAAVPQSPAEPLGWMHSTCPTVWKCESGEREYDWYGVHDVAGG